MQFLFVDVETGGLDASQHSILSLGAIVWTDGHIGETFSCFVCEPAIAVESEAMKVNGINLHTLRATGLAPHIAVEQLHAFVLKHTQRPCILAGWNVGFDVGFLRRLYRLAGESLDKTFFHRSLDVASVFAAVCDAWGGIIVKPTAPTAEILSWLHVDASNRHTAIGDALMAARMYNAIRVKM